MFEAPQLLCKAGNLQADRTLFKQCFRLYLNATNQEALPDEQMLALQLNITIALAIVSSEHLGNRSGKKGSSILRASFLYATAVMAQP